MTRLVPVMVALTDLVLICTKTSLPQFPKECNNYFERKIQTTIHTYKWPKMMM